MVSFIVPVRNAGQTLARCLDSIFEAIRVEGSGEVVVVDGGSTDDTWQILSQAQHPALRRIRAGPGTVSLSRNLGAEMASGDLLAFVDADCLVEPDYVSAARAALEVHHASAVGSTYRLPPHPHRLERAWKHLHPGPDGPGRPLPGGNLAVTRQAFGAVAGFDPRLVSGEDVDFCDRLRQNGFTVYHDSSVAVVHLGNPATLGRFFKQQTWHAEGMLATARGFDRPLALTLLHLGLTAAGVGTVFLAPVPAWASLLLSQAVAPVLAVGYRAARSRDWSWSDLAVGALLYWAYLWARAAGMLRGLRRSPVVRGRDDAAARPPAEKTGPA